MIRKPLFWNNINLISLSLLPISIITLIVNFFKNLFTKKKYKIKTICVGNIYIGGTGKTSLCIEINNILKKKFRTVFIKKKYSDQFDEKQLLTSQGDFLSHTDRKISLKKVENSKKFNLATVLLKSFLISSNLFSDQSTKSILLIATITCLMPNNEQIKLCLLV